MVANGEIATNGLEEEKVDQIKEGEEARNWDLPPEILSLIFSFLDPESLAKAGKKTTKAKSKKRNRDFQFNRKIN